MLWGKPWIILKTNNWLDDVSHLKGEDLILPSVRGENPKPFEHPNWSS